MKTSIDIPEAVLADAMRYTHAKTKRDAVVRALEDFNRKQRMTQLIKYSGTFGDGFPDNDEIEAVDRKRERQLYGRVG